MIKPGEVVETVAQLRELPHDSVIRIENLPGLDTPDIIVRKSDPKDKKPDWVSVNTREGYRSDDIIKKFNEAKAIVIFVA